MAKAIVLLLVPLAVAARGEEVRIATYNSSLSPDAESGQESLPVKLAKPGDDRANRVAEIIQRVNPDILLVNEFNWDAEGAAADAFAKNYLCVGHDAAHTGTPSTPIAFAYRFLPTGASSPFNTGLPSGKDLDHNGQSKGAGDDYGFGQFPGQYGLLLLSKYPIKFDEVRTFQSFRWRDMPGNLIPTEFYSDDEGHALRLSSKSHWDVPIDVHGHTLHVLASHPTPPVFDGDEDRNGQRNADEIRFWRDYVTPGKGTYIYDDQEFAAAGNTAPARPHGGLTPGASFVILGDQNADPVDGASRPNAANQLLKSPRINTSLTPSGTGGPQASKLHGGRNTYHTGNPENDTAAFGKSGNLRVDYVLPSTDLKLLDGRIYWFADNEPLFKLVTHGSFPSDHRAVYVDVELPDANADPHSTAPTDGR